MLRRTAAALAVGALLSTVLPGTASGLPSGGEESAARLIELVEQTPWTPRDGRFSVTVAVDDSVDDATLQIVIRNRVRSREEFGLSVTGEQLRAEAFRTDRVALAELDPDGEGATLTVPIRTDGPFDPERANLRETGVYPVEVRLLDAQGNRLERLMTHLIVVPDPEEEMVPLAAAYVADIAAPPALAPDGSTAFSPADLEELVELSDLLGRHPDVPLTIAATPETIDALADGTDADGVEIVERLRTAAETRQVLALPYVDIDARSLLDAGLGPELADAVERGAAVLTDLLGPVEDETWIADPTLSPSVVDALGDLGRDRFLLTEGQIDPVDAEPPLTQSFAVASAGTTALGATTDGVIGFRLFSHDDPVLAGHQVLAELAVIALDAPSESRGVVVRVPEGAPASATALDTLLDGLEDPNGLVEPVTLDQYFEQVTPLAEAVVDLIPEPAPDLRDLATSLEVTRTLLDSYAALTGPGSSRVEPFERRIIVATAESLTNEERQRYLTAVREELNAAMDVVELPGGKTVTLTARTGVIPLTVRNDSGFPINVVVHFDSDRLEFPDGDAVPRTLSVGLNRLDVSVRTRGSGSFPLRVHVTSPDGGVELARGRVIVRSTAVSGVGVMLSVGALLFLLVWWGRHWRRVSRNRRLVSTHG